jgi:hypothetical protein
MNNLMLSTQSITVLYLVDINRRALGAKIYYNSPSLYRRLYIATLWAPKINYNSPSLYRRFYIATFGRQTVFL